MGVSGVLDPGPREATHCLIGRILNADLGYPPGLSVRHLEPDEPTSAGPGDLRPSAPPDDESDALVSTHACLCTETDTVCQSSVLATSAPRGTNLVWQRHGSPNRVRRPRNLTCSSRSFGRVGSFR